MALQETLSRIEELVNELKSLSPITPENKERLDKKMRLEFNYNTNHLEGNTLTYSETELLLMFDETRGNHTAREYEEMKASNVSYLLVEKTAREKERPLTENFIRQLNEMLLVRPYWKDAATTDGQKVRREILVGEYKKQPNSVRLTNGEMFEYASPMDTPILMSELVNWFNEELEKKESHPVLLAANLHYKFVRIHPFDDGNGRVSRLLMNYVFLYFEFPPVIIKTDDKKNYLSALRDADTGNMESFENYIGRCLIWSLELYIKARKGESIDEAEDWKKKLQVLKTELNSREEIKYLKSADVTQELIKNAIMPLGFELKAELDNHFKDLFMGTYTTFKSSADSANQMSTLSQAIAAFISYQDKYSNDIILTYGYTNFNKDGYEPFSTSISLDFVFNKKTVSIKFKDTLIDEKLYHKPLDTSFSKIINILGEKMYAEIEKGMTQSTA